MNIKDIASKFDFGGDVGEIKENKAGHINSTYFVHCGEKKYVLQKINKNVFKKPDEVMANIGLVTDHIREKLKAEGGDYENGSMFFLNSGDKNYFVDDEGEYWRAYRFINGDCYDSCDSTKLFERVGRAFGRFQCHLADFDASTLYETIPNFHNTVSRYENLEASISKDVKDRVKLVEKEIAFVRERKAVCSIIVDGIASGKYPLKVTHNDTKLNNIIMNPETGEGLCVIDLDTVMPGSMLYDFGDAIRFGAASAAEDETDLDKVYVNVDMFEAFAKGFVDGLGGSATTDEILAFPDAARIITLEIGMRFLTDYLDGDVYFRTEYAEHNLDRARNQFKLVADIESKLSELNKIVESII